jgi:hypothetical protein
MALAEGYTECLIDLAVVQERSSYLLVFVTVEIWAGIPSLLAVDLRHHCFSALDEPMTASA